MHLWKCFF